MIKVWLSVGAQFARARTSGAHPTFAWFEDSAVFGHERSRIGRSIHQDEHVERIAILRTRGRNETELEGRTAPAGSTPPPKRVPSVPRTRLPLCLPQHVPRLLVLAQAHKPRVPQVVIGCPLQKLELAHEQRPQLAARGVRRDKTGVES